ncbi:MAG: hypothetical protein KKA63_03040 [Gammaproteobacteria bacterium]|nr:hypothetical protein [Gammaproteobacteria bacterium]
MIYRDPYTPHTGLSLHAYPSDTKHTLSRSCRVRSVLAFLLTCLLPFSANAFQAMDIESKKESSMLFAPYESNSFMFKRTDGDAPSSEINISVRYFFKDPVDRDTKAVVYGFNPFFSYTGKYDFYWWPVRDTRPSAPVISRYQNPAIHLRYLIPDSSYSRVGDWGDIGLEHISNGQALTVQDNLTTVQNAYQSNNNAVMDSISRVGALYAITFEGRKMLTERSDLTLKWYAYRASQEADVAWGPYANRNVSFNDFQRIRVQWRIKYDGFGFTDLPWQFSAEANIGSLGLSEDSWNFLLNTPVRIGKYEFPFALSAHRGPMNNLSDYTRPQNTFAAGFTFAY